MDWFLEIKLNEEEAGTELAGESGHKYLSLGKILQFKFLLRRWEEDINRIYHLGCGRGVDMVVWIFGIYLSTSISKKHKNNDEIVRHADVKLGSSNLAWN